MMNGLYLFLFLMIALPINSDAQSDVDTFSLAPPASFDSMDQLSIWATEYYVHITESKGEIPYLTAKGDSLGYFSDTCDFCTACLEGTVFIESDSNETVVLNYATRSKNAIVNCRECPKFQNSKLNVESWGSVRWKISSGFGEGVKGFKLVPFRTIAVDPNTIPYGTVIYVPAAVGDTIVLSDTTWFTHDGYFFAGDTGGAIKKNHIDVFTGIDSSHPFGFVRSSSNYTTEVYIVVDESIVSFLRGRHKNN